MFELLFLDENPKKSVQSLANGDLLNTIFSLASVLSAAHRYLDSDMDGKLPDAIMDKKLYRNNKEVHGDYKSDTFQWISAGSENYRWAYVAFVEALKEYHYRFRKHHGCKKLESLLAIIPKKITKTETVIKPNPPIPAMSHESFVGTYRRYYVLSVLSGRSKWSDLRKKPEWVDSIEADTSMIPPKKVALSPQYQCD